MEKSVLLSKKETYSSVKQALVEKDYSAEIEAEVNKLRQTLTEKYETERQKEINKCDVYLRFIDECLDEIAEKEQKEEVVDYAADSTM